MEIEDGVSDLTSKYLSLMNDEEKGVRKGRVNYSPDMEEDWKIVVSLDFDQIEDDRENGGNS